MSETEKVEEGWKSTAAGIAAGLGIGSAAIHHGLDNILGHKSQPAQVAPAQTAPLQAIEHARSLLKTPSGQDLKSVAEAAGIRGKELAAFLAQCAHESQNFTRLKEYGGSLDFRKYDPLHAPRKARELGNKIAGDGMRFIGRGYLHITGRWNYKQLEKALNLPLTKHPELLEKPHIAARAAVWYWQNRVEPNVSNFDDINATTKPINKGLKGIEDRYNKYVGFKHVLSEPKTAK